MKNYNSAFRMLILLVSSFTHRHKMASSDALDKPNPHQAVVVAAKRLVAASCACFRGDKKLSLALSLEVLSVPSLPTLLICCCIYNVVTMA